MSDERNLLVHVTTLPQSFRAYSNHLMYLTDRGIRIHTVSSRGELPEQLAQREGLVHHTIGMSRAITPGRDLISLIRLIFLFARLKPLIVHAHTPKAGLLAMCAARVVGVPVRIYHIRGLRFVTATGWRAALLKSCERMACSFSSQVLCVSRSVTEVAINEGIVAADRIKVLLNGGHGFDSRRQFNPATLPAGTRDRIREKYAIPANAPVIGFVGRLVKEKGIEELTAAWRVLRNEFPTLRLLLVGPFESEDPIRPEVVTTLKSDPRVSLAGQTWDTPPLYLAMDIVCLPTYREGLPKVPLEAAGMERPVVATRIPGCVDAVQEGVTGTLVEPQNSTELAAALRNYLTHSDLAQTHGAAGRQRVVADFPEEAMWAALHNEYRRLGLKAGYRLTEHPSTTQTRQSEHSRAA